MAHTPIPDQVTGEGCGFANAVRVTRGAGVAFGDGFAATCPLAVAWSMFETHVLQPAARRHFGQDVSRVVHFGSYACRNINHGDARPAQRARPANALDVAGFVARRRHSASPSSRTGSGAPRPPSCATARRRLPLLRRGARARLQRRRTATTSTSTWAATARADEPGPRAGGKAVRPLRASAAPRPNSLPSGPWSCCPAGSGTGRSRRPASPRPPCR